MAVRVFVTATNTDVGKTYTVLQLMHTAAQAGLRPVAYKPIETGVTDKPADGLALLNACKHLNPACRDLAPERVVSYRFALAAAPFVAKGKTTIEKERLARDMRFLESLGDILFIEGAGGPLVPIEKDLFMIDLPALFNAQTLLVTPGRLGAVNDTLLCVEALNRRGIDPHIVVNLRPGEKETFERLNRPCFEAAGLSYRLIPREADKVIASIV